jgi:energy-coupling factor transporter ATP-binding protein EcfA2
MALCLAGALSFNLATPESADNRPVFAQLMLDEAFSKSDSQFAQQALQAFRKFGVQLVIIATVQKTTIQPYSDSVVMVSKTEPTGRNAPPRRLGGGQDDPGIHHAAPRNARDGGTDASHGLMSTTASSPLIATDARNGAPSRSCTTASRRS